MFILSTLAVMPYYVLSYPVEATLSLYEDANPMPDNRISLRGVMIWLIPFESMSWPGEDDQSCSCLLVEILQILQTPLILTPNSLFVQMKEERISNSRGGPAPADSSTSAPAARYNLQLARGF